MREPDPLRLSGFYEGFSSRSDRVRGNRGLGFIGVHVKSVFSFTLDQFSHGRMRNARHPGADALQETVIPELPARDGLVIGIPGRLRQAGQQSLDQRINEREQSLLCQLEAAHLAANAFQIRGDSLLRCIHPTLAAGEFPIYRRPDERCRAGETTVPGRAFNSLDHQAVDSQAASDGLALGFGLHIP